jgi:hypothetical protein
MAGVWIVDVDGTNERCVVVANQCARDLTWAPHGERLAFVVHRGHVGVSDDPETRGIYTIRPDGTDLR